MTTFTRHDHDDQDGPTRSDPDLDGLETADEPSDLDDIRGELAADVVPTVTLPVDPRPGYTVVYRIDFTSLDLDGLRKRSKDRRFTDKIDGVKLDALLLAFTCQDVLRHGVSLGQALGEDGPVTFTSRALQELYGTSDAQSTVRAFYGLEGYLDGAARKLLSEAGWGDDVDIATDPTV